MKVLQINCVYNKGSTGKITYDIHNSLLSLGHESVVVYGRGEKVDDKNVYKCCGELYSKINHLYARLSGIMYGGCYFSTRKLIRIIKKERPDVVHLQCINGYFVNVYKLIKYLNVNKITTIVTLHAEFMYTANCGHALDCDEWKTGCKNCTRYKKETESFLFNRTAKSWQKMKKAFTGAQTFTITSVSPWLQSRAKESDILGCFNHEVVLNGLDSNVFKYTDPKGLRDKLGLTNKKVVLFVAPVFSTKQGDFKGGDYLIKLAKAFSDDDTTFLVVGKVLEKLDLPKNVIACGQILDKEELARYYSLADATVLLSKRETFSMVTAESLSCGTKVVGFKAGAPEQIAIKEYSKFVDYGDVDTLIESLRETLKSDYDKKEIERLAKDKYDNSCMIQGYLDLYNRVINK